VDRDREPYPNRLHARQGQRGRRPGGRGPSRPAAARRARCSTRRARRWPQPRV